MNWKGKGTRYYIYRCLSPSKIDNASRIGMLYGCSPRHFRHPVSALEKTLWGKYRGAVLKFHIWLSHYSSPCCAFPGWRYKRYVEKKVMLKFKFCCDSYWSESDFRVGLQMTALITLGIIYHKIKGCSSLHSWMAESSIQYNRACFSVNIKGAATLLSWRKTW